MSEQLTESLIYKSVRHNERLGRLESQERNSVSADAFVHACSVFQCLTGLRGFWPMSSFNEAGNAYDLSGQGRILTYNGNPTYNYAGLAPYIDMDGTGDFLSRANEVGLQISGTESYVAAAVRGLTCGGWFYTTDMTAQQGLLTKRAIPAGNHSWDFEFRGDLANDPVQFWISDDGTNITLVSLNNAISVNTWHFIWGRFDPAAFVYVGVDGQQNSAATARLSIFPGNGPLNIGAIGSTAAYLNGRASLCFLCAATLSDAIIQALYQQTRGFFGV